MAPPHPCKFTWRVGVGWIPDPANGESCPEEEHCAEPTNPGTFDGMIDFGPCLPLGADPRDPGGGNRAGKKKRGKG